MQDAIQSSVYVSSPEHAGWLTKRGFHWRKLWKKKWVALHGTEIVYMDKEPTAENAATITITKAQISTTTEIISDDLEGNPNGFQIQINDGHSPTWYLRAENSREKNKWVLRLSYTIAIVRWLGDFEKIRVLGVGGTGIVYELLHRCNGQRYAMKEMEIKNAHQMGMAISEAEMLKDIMENVSHPNIMHIEKVFQVGSKFYLVFPLCTGGELYEHIIKRGHFTEHDAAMLTYDLIGGLHALHQHEILHLDIKPENILFESMADDAKIKITDFGLSKLSSLAQEDGPGTNFVSKIIQGSSNKPNRPKSISRSVNQYNRNTMDEKMKNFMEDGELNCDRIKGTVGYMSPELILTGHATKATDVFAAGVVLYILLCGRPPFHSNGNREVLEKTCRGVIKMNGAEWSDVSSEAKDLVRKMLTVYPEDRISCEEILQHPWIVKAREEAEKMNNNNNNSSLSYTPGSSVDTIGGDKLSPLKSLTSPKVLAMNLTGALKNLSGHVKHMKTEKFAASVTRLVSAMQSEGGKSQLAQTYLTPLGGNTSPVPDNTSNSSNNNSRNVSPINNRSGAVTPDPTKSPNADDNENEIVMLMNSDLKEALTTAIANVARSLNEQDDDPNHEGKLTIEQFMIILKHFNFTAQNNSKLSIGALFFCKFLDRDNDGYISVDDISTGQALIMQRSESFIKMIFRLYIEILWYPGRNMNLMSIVKSTPMKGVTIDSSESGKDMPNQGGKIITTDSIITDVVEPPKFITGRHVAAVFEKLGYDPANGHKVFTLLCEALGRIKVDRHHDCSHSKDDANCDKHSHNNTNNISRNDNSSSELAHIPSVTSHTSSNHSRGSMCSEDDDEPLANSGQSNSNNNNNNNAKLSTPGSISNKPKNTIQKMDLADFKRAIEIDDILLQVIFRKPRTKIMGLVRKSFSSSKSSSGGNAARVNVIEEELKAAFNMLSVNNKNNNNNNATTGNANGMGTVTPTRSGSVLSVGRATINSVFGLAAKVTSGAQALLNDFVGDFDYDDEEDGGENRGENDNSIDYHN